MYGKDDLNPVDALVRVSWDWPIFIYIFAYNPLESLLLLFRVYRYLASWPEKCVATGQSDLVTILSGSGRSHS